MDPLYGYETDGHQTIEARREHIATKWRSETLPVVSTVASGAVRYLSWSPVTDWQVSIDARDTKDRSVLRPSIVLERGDEPAVVRHVEPGKGPHVVIGSYDRVTLVVAHVDALATEPVEFEYSAKWLPCE